MRHIGPSVAVVGSLGGGGSAARVAESSASVDYFDCADPSLPTFRAVRAALRDVTSNPEVALRAGAAHVVRSADRGVGGTALVIVAAFAKRDCIGRAGGANAYS